MLRLESDGALTPCEVQRRRGGQLLHNKRVLHEHYRDEHVCLLSTVRPSDVSDKRAALHPFTLPPPLNAYIYPSPLYVMSSNACETTAAWLVAHCARLTRVAYETDRSDVIYDIPVLAAPVEEPDDASDPESELDAGDDDARSDETDEDMPDDEWGEDDDDECVPTTSDARTAR